MILDDIVEKRKEQLQREKDNIEPQDMKEMALNSNFSFAFPESIISAASFTPSLIVSAFPIV